MKTKMLKKKDFSCFQTSCFVYNTVMTIAMNGKGGGGEELNKCIGFLIKK